MKNFTRLWIIRAGILFIALTVAGCGGRGSSGQAGGKTIATVNYKKITDRQVEKRLALFQIAYGHKFAANEMAAARSAMAEQLIDEYILVAEAKKRRLIPAEKDVAREVVRLKGMMRDQSFGGSASKLNSTLKHAGITDQDLTDMTRNELAIRALQQQVIGGLKVTQAEAKQYYEANKSQMRQPESVKIREIRFEKLEDGEKALAEIKGGADFAEVAKKYMPNPAPNMPNDATHAGLSGAGGDPSSTGGDASRQAGGVMGPFFRGSGQLAKELEDAAFALKSGETSGVIQTPLGYHIIKVEEVTPSKEFTFEEIKDRLANGLLQQKQQQAWERFLTGLRDQAKVKRF